MAALLIVVNALLAASWGQGICGDRTAVGRIVEVMTIDDRPVEVRRGGDSEWVLAERGLTVCAGDQIRTRFRSKARVRLAAEGAEQPIEMVVGVNARVRFAGDWSARASETADRPVLEILHGVIRLDATEPDAVDWAYVRSGPTTCRFAGREVLSNWDPFKREANHVVLSGSIACSFQDSTITVQPGQRIEIRGGEPLPVTLTPPLILDSFTRATTLD